MKRIVLIILAVLLISNVFALNKLRVKDMKWRIYETEHFKVYYYENEAFLAKLAAIYAEEGYTINTEIMKFSPKEKIALFIYEDHMDFAATNITLSFLGEGTGGFTEPLKNRIALPGSGSFKALRQVVHHEITHAMQFAIMFGEGLKSYNVLYKNAFVPLWVMEGLAEYAADDFDTKGDMVVRDAVINDRLIPPSKLEGFSHLEEVYLAYKEAQNIYMYIAKKYGEDKIATIIGRFRDEVNVQFIIKDVLKKDFAEFEKEWMFYMKKKYWAQIAGRDEPKKYGPQMTFDDHNHIIHNTAPEFSPDGNHIAYMSSKEGHREMFLMNSNGTERRKLWDRFEGLSTGGFPISWSNDNKTIYFASTKRGKRIIYRGNVDTGELGEITIPGITNLYSPSISPDDKYIAFIGVEKGFSDVFVYNIETKKVMNISRNVFENDSVRWSEKGEQLVFTEERGDYKRIVLYNNKTGRKKFLTGVVNYDYETPRFMNDKEIVCTSDKNGIFNLYTIDIKKGKETQLTNIMNGIFYPSVSEQFIAYSYYNDACYNIYKFMTGREREFLDVPLAYDEDFNAAGKEDVVVPVRKKIDEVIVADTDGTRDDIVFINKTETQAGEIIISDSDYTSGFTPDLLFAVLGFGTDMGIAGGAYVQMSDMLGDHNVSMTLNTMPGSYTQLDLSYLYLGLPFDVGTRLFYNQNKYNLYDVEKQEFFSQLESMEVGGSLQLKYPLNLYNSIGVTFGSRRINDQYTNLETSHTYVFPEDEHEILNTAALYFMTDYSAWRDYWPYSGDSILAYIEISEQMFGGTKSYELLEIDYRKYFDLSWLSGRNTSISLKTLFAMTSGRDKPYFLVGGINTIRGIGYGSYSGDKVLLLNVELRQTLAKNINFELWPFNFIMIKSLKVAIFVDSGVVKKDKIHSVVNEDVKSGFGLGVIFDTFMLQKQYTPLKFEIAKRIDVTDPAWKFYFSINTSF